jgi:hypothetical protein
MQNPQECPIGKYCPAKTASITEAAYTSDWPVNCPAGTYSDIVNIGSADECKPCPVGQWCAAGTDAEPTSQPCDETFFCPYGSSAQNGYTDDYVFGLGASGLCPAGYTCPAGTIAPVPCPVGEFQALSGQTTCDDCTRGYYCDEVGMSALVDFQRCDAGYYCTEAGKSNIPNPTDGVMGN